MTCLSERVRERSIKVFVAPRASRFESVVRVPDGWEADTERMVSEMAKDIADITGAEAPS